MQASTSSLPKPSTAVYLACGLATTALAVSSIDPGFLDSLPKRLFSASDCPSTVSTEYLSSVGLCTWSRLILSNFCTVSSITSAVALPLAYIEGIGFIDFTVRLHTTITFRQDHLSCSFSAYSIHM